MERLHELDTVGTGRRQAPGLPSCSSSNDVQERVEAQSHAHDRPACHRPHAAPRLDRPRARPVRPIGCATHSSGRTVPGTHTGRSKLVRRSRSALALAVIVCTATIAAGPAAASSPTASAPSASASGVWSVSQPVVSPVLADDPYTPVFIGGDPDEGDPGDCWLTGFESRAATGEDGLQYATGCGGVRIQVTIGSDTAGVDGVAFMSVSATSHVRLRAPSHRSRSHRADGHAPAARPREHLRDPGGGIKAGAHACVCAASARDRLLPRRGASVPLVDHRVGPVGHHRAVQHLRS